MQDHRAQTARGVFLARKGPRDMLDLQEWWGFPDAGATRGSRAPRGPGETTAPPGRRGPRGGLESRDRRAPWGSLDRTGSPEKRGNLAPLVYWDPLARPGLKGTGDSRGHRDRQDSQDPLEPPEQRAPRGPTACPAPRESKAMRDTKELPASPDPRVSKASQDPRDLVVKLA